MTRDAAEAASASDWMSGFHQMSGRQRAGGAGGGDIHIGAQQRNTNNTVGRCVLFEWVQVCPTFRELSRT